MTLPVRRNGAGDPTPRTFINLPRKGPTVLMVSCTERWGAPRCMGAAGGGPDRCTCSTLTPLEHAFCERIAREMLRRRDYEPCPDCACRAGTPERESGELEKILAQDAPFHCHRGMPMVRRGGGPPTRYAPRRDANGVPSGYPVCMGWLAARLRRAESGEASG